MTRWASPHQPPADPPNSRVLPEFDLGLAYNDRRPARSVPLFTRTCSLPASLLQKVTEPPVKPLKIDRRCPKPTSSSPHCSSFSKSARAVRMKCSAAYVAGQMDAAAPAVGDSLCEGGQLEHRAVGRARKRATDWHRGARPIPVTKLQLMSGAMSGGWQLVLCTLPSDSVDDECKVWTKGAIKRGKKAPQARQLLSS